MGEVRKSTTTAQQRSSSSKSSSKKKKKTTTTTQKKNGSSSNSSKKSRATLTTTTASMTTSGKSTKDRPNKKRSTSSSSSKMERFRGVEDTTPRVSHLRKTVSDARLSKAKSIPTLNSDNKSSSNKEDSHGNKKALLVDAASAVTNQLSNAIHKLADMTSDFLYPIKTGNVDQPGLVDVSTETIPSSPESIRLKLETTFSTITTEADGQECEAHNGEKTTTPSGAAAVTTTANLLDHSLSEYENSIVEKEEQEDSQQPTPTRRRRKQRTGRDNAKRNRKSSSFSDEKKMDETSYHTTPDRSSSFDDDDDFDDNHSQPSNPPPQLVEGRDHASSTACHQQHLHRPVPVPGNTKSLLNESSDLTASSSCETPKRVAPKRDDDYAYNMRTTPIARMRQQQQQQQQKKKKKKNKSSKSNGSPNSVVDNDDDDDDNNTVTPTRTKSEEELKKEKQRKWRRRMKMAEKRREKERRELYDDATSAVGTTATVAAGPCKDGLRAVLLESTTSPVRMLQQMIRTRCGVLEDSLSFDSGDNDSQSGASSEEELVTTEEEEEEEEEEDDDEEESVDGNSPRTDRNRSQETSYYVDSPASDCRSNVTPDEERTGPATPPRAQPDPIRTTTIITKEAAKAREEFAAFPVVPTGSSTSKTMPAEETFGGTVIVKSAADDDIAAMFLNTTIPVDGGDSTKVNPTTTPGMDSGASFTKSETSSAAKLELNDKNFIKAFIAESSKDGIPLLWHKEEPIVNSFSRPSPVICFLAFGSKGTTGAFEGPRLVWALSEATFSTESIDLFDIRSLDRASPLQLQAYPFAIPGRSILVRCSNGNTNRVFEAATEGDAQRFIHGMRWVVARLAFNLIIGNLDVCCELLNVSKVDNNDVERKASSLPPSQLEEVQWAKAMNEVTHQLVEKSVFQTAE